jgi:hypothetical protein
MNAARRTFLTQVIFSTIGMGFSVSMLVIGRDPSIYLPIFTSILFAWLPSPMQQQHSSPDPPAPALPRDGVEMVVPLENYVAREENLRR